MVTRKERFSLLVAAVLVVTTVAAAAAQPPLPVHDDPLVRMPGTQPPPENNIDINNAAGCLRCHAGYNPSIEPGYNWLGSMMTQAARDFLFWPTVVVAAQDAMWAVGSPNAADICLRCHLPGGWLAGRSDPPNASAMRLDDYDGLTCDFCHRMVDPFFEDTYAGIREGSDWLNYWDETNASVWPSAAAAEITYNQDYTDSLGITLFNGDPFYGLDSQPVSVAYTENGGGQFFVSTHEDRRASFADSFAGHGRLYSRYHKSRNFCATCHDVSNPVLHNLGADPAEPLPTELDAAHSYFHVERTWSEFALSAYGQQGGAAGIGPFAPDQFETSYASDYIAKCQDCHMRDVVGRAANKPDAVLRPDGSVEHPESGQPLHDLTGGNAWVSWVLASTVPGSPNFDQVNHDLLYQSPLSITLPITAGVGISPTALLAGSERAKQQLDLAAAIENLSYNPATGALDFRIQNQTGHKLISGYPEGRRMFVNVRLYSGATLLYEINPYDPVAATLKGMPNAPLGPNEEYRDELVYEAKTSSLDITGEAQTFHFALATDRYKDNRIPPKGFDIDNAAQRLVQPVWAGAADPAYYTAAEYAGGYDDVSMSVATGAHSVEVNLYYQTTSREYITFLRDEINGTGDLTLPAEAYTAQSDPFFAQLRPWGDTIWALWEHNKDAPGAAPYLMAAGAWQGPPDVRPLPPVLTSAITGPYQITLTWTLTSTGRTATGHRVYYDQGGKQQLVAEIGLVSQYVDTGLTGGERYCYHVTTLDHDLESELSNMECATAQHSVHIYVPLLLRMQ